MSKEFLEGSPVIKNKNVCLNTLTQGNASAFYVLIWLVTHQRLVYEDGFLHIPAEVFP